MLLRLRQRGKVVQRGPEQKMQSRERQVTLTHHASAVDHSHPHPARRRNRTCTPGGVVQQRCLADTRIPADD